MALTTPIIVGPISELTDPYGIRVKGLFVGATVLIFTSTPSNFQIAHGIATSSDQRFELNDLHDSGAALRSDMHLFAIQELDERHSSGPSGNLFAQVQPKPHSQASIGSIAFKSHIYECGQFLWVTGAIPGAMVEIWSINQLLGSGPCLEGDARIALTTPVSPDDTVTARQVIGGFSPGSNLPSTADKIPRYQDSRGLRPPQVREPVRGCDQSIFVHDVYDGAWVAIQPTISSPERAPFELSAMEFILQDPLKEGENFTIEQSVYEKCERFGVPNVISVGPLQPVDPPVVAEPLCEGGCFVHLSNLRPGSKVYINNNDTTFVGQTGPDVTSDDFQLPPLHAGTLFAQQEQCEVKSENSNVVTVTAREDHVKACQIVPHVYECARNVSINNIHAPSTLEVCRVEGDRLIPISDIITVFESQTVISVSPYIEYPGDLVVRQWACSDESIRSEVQRVELLPDIPSPIPSPPIYEGDKAIGVLSTIAGARVELWVNQNKGADPWTFGGWTEANNISDTSIDTNLDIKAGDLVRVVQFICLREPAENKPIVTAIDPGGARPFYSLAHNPDSVDEVKFALVEGSNGIGPDVTAYEHGGGLCIGHYGPLGNATAPDGAPDLVSFLKGLHDLAVQFPALGLVIFDCKPPSISPENGAALLNAIREYLTFDLPLLSIVISVGNRAGVSMFKNISNILRSREGLMIDEDNEAGNVAKFFADLGVNNACYGNGSSATQIPILVPNLRPSIESACGIHAATNRMKFVYEWTNDDADYMRQYIAIGVHGIMSSMFNAIGPPGLLTLLRVIQEPQWNGIIRFATRQDNPFRPPNANYELIVHTGDIGGGGTDSNITFNLWGQSGPPSSVTVDADLDGRMESGHYNYVVMPSRNLNPLKQISISKSGGGLSANWYLESIVINSWRWGVQDVKVVFGQWVDNSSAVTRQIM